MASVRDGFSPAELLCNLNESSVRAASQTCRYEPAQGAYPARHVQIALVAVYSRALAHQ